MKKINALKQVKKWRKELEAWLNIPHIILNFNSLNSEIEIKNEIIKDQKKKYYFS